MGSIENRRSIRQFKNKKIKEELIEAVLQAGLLAPSPKNRQPWRFVVISDEDEKNEMVVSMRREIMSLIQRKPDRLDIKESLETMKVMEQADVVILVGYEYGMTEQHEDGVEWALSAKDLEVVELLSIGASIENMLLKAEELGVGSLWCADILYAYNVVSKYSARPVVSAICLGYADEIPKARPRNTISKMCEFYRRER